MTDFRARAFNFFTGQGWSPVAAAALAGQGNWESRGNPAAVHDGGIGIGLYGWNGDRRKALYDFAAQYQMDPASEDTQLRFAHHELTNGNERKWGDTLKGAADLTGATNAVLGYLRPSGWTAANPTAGHGYQQRYNEAAQLANLPVADPRTMGDADLAGYGGSPALMPREEPKDTSDPYGKMYALGRGLLSAGMPQQAAQPMQVQQGQAYRGRPGALALLDTLTKRGLLG